MTLCCAYKCKNDGSHIFPKDPALKKQWEIAIKRINFVVGTSSRLCSDHFKPGDFNKIGFFSGSFYILVYTIPSVINKFLGLENSRKILKKGAVPSIFSYHSIRNRKAVEARQKRILWSTAAARCFLYRSKISFYWRWWSCGETR